MNDGITDAQLDLCQRIRAHCQDQRWFGPSTEKTLHLRLCEYYQLSRQCDCTPLSNTPLVGEHSQIQELCLVHSLRTGFEFPPATSEQVRRTEEALGHPLPAMLRALYTTVANGGFGPFYGLTGIAGGYTAGVSGHCQTLDQVCKEDPALEYVDLSEYLQEWGNPLYLELSSSRHVWFKHFWPICYIGCKQDYYVDGKSGRIYSDSVGLPDKGGDTRIIEYEAASLEEWLERWMQYDR